MKKLTLALATLLCATFTFTSCSEDDETFALLGAWQCTEISGNAGGFDLSSFLSTSSNETASKYTKVFSIYFVGGTSGYYYRVGDESTFSGAASSLISSASSDNQSAWDSFLSSGNYVASGNTLTLTSKDGDVETYQYTLIDGVLTLTSEGTDVTGGNETAANVTSIINSILAVSGSNNTISTSVGLTYTYKKIGLTDLIALFSKSE